MRNIDREFWEGLREWNVIILMEMWIDKKGWHKAKKNLPRGYVWERQKTTRKN